MFPPNFPGNCRHATSRSSGPSWTTRGLMLAEAKNGGPAVPGAGERGKYGGTGWMAVGHRSRSVGNHLFYSQPRRNPQQFAAVAARGHVGLRAVANGRVLPRGEEIPLDAVVPQPFPLAVRRPISSSCDRVRTPGAPATRFTILGGATPGSHLSHG